jgi:uncharacterized membrane protein
MKYLGIVYTLASAALIAVNYQSGKLITLALTLTCVLMCAIAFASAVVLLGRTAALRFAFVGITLGWFAEQMGASKGWFFGRYDYTDVLGAKFFAVPIVIPLMWFTLAYIGYVMSNLIVLHAPVDKRYSHKRAAAVSFIAAMIVTAYDLGADPYLVFTLKAWIMSKTDGWWFGETVQGFFGWVFVAFVIVMSFRLWTRNTALAAPGTHSRKAALVPLLMYGASMAFQIFFGMPVETRSIAAFAMGIPLLCALAGWWQWKTS